MNRLKEANGAPKRGEGPTRVNAGSPTRGGHHGDGTAIVGSVAKHERRGSPRKRTRACPLIKTGRVGIDEFYTREVCEMQDAQTYLELIRDRRKKPSPFQRSHRQLFTPDPSPTPPATPPPTKPPPPPPPPHPTPLPTSP